MKPTNLVNAVQNISGASFVGLDTLTTVKLTGGRGNPHQGRVTKRMTGASVMCFQNKTVSGYEEMVRRRLDAEGKDPASFVIGPRMWGERIPNLPVVVHHKDGSDHYYLEVIFLRQGRVEYLLDGVPVKKEDIQGLPVVKEDPDAQAGLENKVIIRTFAADSITAIRIDGKEFT